MSNTTIDNRLRTINALSKANDEIMKRIISKHNTQVNLVTYNIVHSNGIMTVSEQTVPQQGSQVVANWRSVVELQQIPDIFNDKINYSCTTYQDLQRLNKGMLFVAQKYELFGEGEKAHREIGKFEDNFKQIQMALMQLLELIETGGYGHANDIRAQLDNVNNQLKALRDKYKNIAFQ